MNRIKQLRNEKGINQDVLAKLLGLETAGISKLETGRVPLKDEYIIKLANYFDVSTDYLLGNSNTRKTEQQIKDEFSFAYHKETEGLSEDEIKEALEFYKRIKYGKNKENQNNKKQDQTKNKENNKTEKKDKEDKK